MLPSMRHFRLSAYSECRPKTGSGAVALKDSSIEPVVVANAVSMRIVCRPAESPIIVRWSATKLYR
jgi:hypothetical protein